MPPFAPNELDDSAHAKLDKDVLNILMDEVEPSNTSRAAFWLSTIVQESEGVLDQYYRTVPKAHALIKERPDIREKLEEAWKTRSFKTIRNLPEFQCRPSTPVKPKTVFDDVIKKFLDEHRPKMHELVKKAGDVPSLLPSWNPNCSNEVLAKHISDLHIPTVEGGQPSLLLHNLGEVDGDLVTRRISEIFNTHTLLINTSGSGKTRLLLDGLCHHWGFYFVARPDASGVGSSDFQDIMAEVDDAKGYTDGMKAVEERRLARLLLARFLLLNLLIEGAGKIPGGYKRRCIVAYGCFCKHGP